MDSCDIQTFLNDYCGIPNTPEVAESRLLITDLINKWENYRNNFIAPASGQVPKIRKIWYRIGDRACCFSDCHHLEIEDNIVYRVSKNGNSFKRIGTLPLNLVNEHLANGSWLEDTF